MGYVVYVVGLVWQSVQISSDLHLSDSVIYLFLFICSLLFGVLESANPCVTCTPFCYHVLLR